MGRKSKEVRQAENRRAAASSRHKEQTALLHSADENAYHHARDAMRSDGVEPASHDALAHHNVVGHPADHGMIPYRTLHDPSWAEWPSGVADHLPPPLRPPPPAALIPAYPAPWGPGGFGLPRPPVDPRDADDWFGLPLPPPHDPCGSAVFSREQS